MLLSCGYVVWVDPLRLLCFLVKKQVIIVKLPMALILIMQRHMDELTECGTVRLKANSKIVKRIFVLIIRSQSVSSTDYQYKGCNDTQRKMSWNEMRNLYCLCVWYKHQVRGPGGISLKNMHLIVISFELDITKIRFSTQIILSSASNFWQYYSIVFYIRAPRATGAQRPSPAGSECSCNRPGHGASTLVIRK